MTWHGQINRTIWEIENLLEKRPKDLKLGRELLRAHFLQRFEYDRSLHVPRDDRSFLFLQEEKAPAMLVLHGAHGSPAEVRDLGNYFYGKGFTVYCPRLARYDLKNRMVTWESWVTMAENALTTVLRYSPNTIVTGLSLGGTISMILSGLHDIRGMVLLAPAIYPKLGFKGRFQVLARHASPTLFFRFAGWNGETTKAMERVRRSEQNKNTPVLTLQARDDQVVSTRGLKHLKKWARGGQSEVVLLPSGTHALTRGQAKQEVFARMYDFAQKIQVARTAP
ncbi:MAG: alpha/beta hydrolase [Candidatus Krumholzibacteriia bacterium]